LTGSVQIEIVNPENLQRAVRIQDNAYGHPAIERTLSGSRLETFPIETPRSHGWYDLTVSLVEEPAFEKRYAGRVETGKWSFSDPLMGGV
jgi:phospholipase C